MSLRIIDLLIMDSDSRRTLRRIQRNDDTLTELCVGNAYGDNDSTGTVWCWDRGDYQRLGVSIGKNKFITKLDVAEEIATETIANDDLIVGLQQNSSIIQLKLTGEHVDIAQRAGQQILDAYQGKNQLTHLQIWDCYLTHASITKTLKCNNLQEIELIYCQITNEHLLPIIEAIRGRKSLEQLSFYGNIIGNTACEAIATLLADPNCNITNFDLRENNIGNEGAIMISDGLKINNKLRRLFLHANPIINNHVQDAWDLQSAFSQALCNTSSVSSTYSSNHTLKYLELPHFMNEQFYDILELNDDTNKKHVAITKILQNHPNIDMEPMFGWKTGGEWSLRALPYVIDWYERAEEAAMEGDHVCTCEVWKRQLSSVYQFALAMPLLFVPTPRINVVCKKRKRKGNIHSYTYE